MELLDKKDEKHSKPQNSLMAALGRAASTGDINKVTKLFPAIRGKQVKEEEGLLLLSLDAPSNEVFRFLFSQHKNPTPFFGRKLTGCIALYCQHWDMEEQQAALKALRKKGFLLHTAHQAVLDEDYQAALTKEAVTHTDVERNNIAHYASARGNLLLLESLKNGKTDFLFLIQSMNNSNWSPLSFAARNGHTKTASWLVNTLQEILPSTGALKAKTVENYILKPDKQGNTAFLLAAAGGHLDTARYLWGKNNDQIAHKNGAGNTALHLAAAGGHFDTTQWLVEEAKADVNTGNIEGDTPLLCAITSGHLQVVRCLVLEGKANITQPNSQGKTTLEVAVESGQLEVLQFLLSEEGGAQITTPELANKILKCAATHDHIVMWLVSEHWLNPGDGVDIAKWFGLSGKKQARKAKELKDLFDSRYVRLVKNWDTHMEASGVLLVDSSVASKKISPADAEKQVLQQNEKLLKDLKSYSESDKAKWKGLATELYSKIISQPRCEPATIRAAANNFFAAHPEIDDDTLSSIIQTILLTTTQSVTVLDFVERERKNSQNSPRNLQNAAEPSPRHSFSLFRKKSTDTRENPLIPKSSSNNHVASDLPPAGGSTSDNKQSGPSSRFSFSFSRKKSTEKAEGSNAVPSSQSLGRKDSGATVQDIPPAVSNTTGDNISPTADNLGYVLPSSSTSINS